MKLVKKYNAHINVEIATSISSVKYLYKYVYKGGVTLSLFCPLKRLGKTICRSFVASEPPVCVMQIKPVGIGKMPLALPECRWHWQNAVGILNTKMPTG